MSKKEVQRREFFRIEFPPSERPGFVVDGRTHSIIDLSEEGVKAHWSNTDLPFVGNSIKGLVVFSDGSKDEVQGKVIRTKGHEVIINLSKGIPYPKMLEEQRRLIRKYKDK